MDKRIDITISNCVDCPYVHFKKGKYYCKKTANLKIERPEIGIPRWCRLPDAGPSLFEVYPDTDKPGYDDGHPDNHKPWGGRLGKK